MKIDTLKGTISRRNGFARANRFDLFVVPPAKAFEDVDQVRDLNILCESCNFPGRQIQTFETNYTRQQVKVAQSFINEDISLTFNLTNDFYIKRIFDKWTNLIIDRDTFKKNYDSVYKRDMYIYQNDSNNKRVYEIEVRNAFPISVQSIEASNSGEDIQKLTIEFTYEDFKERSI
jgi:hypothetical protein